MRDLTKDIRNELLLLTKSDEAYQTLLRKCRKLEVEYLRVIARRKDDERACADEYILLCEEMQYSMTQLAYWRGVLEGRSGS